MDETMMAYCGLDCSRCFGHTGTVSGAAKSLRRTIRAEKVKQVWTLIPFPGDYDTFKKTLDGLSRLGRTICREGGGNPWCKIGIWAQKRQLETRARCDGFEACEKLAFLEAGDKREHIKDFRRLRKAMA